VQACTRAEDLLDKTGRGLGRVHALVKKARADLEAFRDEPAGASSPPKKRALKAAVTRRLATDLSSRLGDARDSIESLTDAAVVANSILDGLAELPVASSGRLDQERLKETSQRLQSVAEQARQLSARLKKTPAKDGDDAQVRQTSARMNQVLAQVSGSLEELISRADACKGDIAEIRREVASWLTTATVAASVVLFWGALGQLSLVAQGCSWWRRAGKPVT
jgi:hypothetical protein